MTKERSACLANQSSTSFQGSERNWKRSFSAFFFGNAGVPATDGFSALDVSDWGVGSAVALLAGEESCPRKGGGASSGAELEPPDLDDLPCRRRGDSGADPAASLAAGLASGREASFSAAEGDSGTRAGAARGPAALDAAAGTLTDLAPASGLGSADCAKYMEPKTTIASIAIDLVCQK